MIDLINLAIAMITIAFGLFGFLAPRYTASALDLQTGETTMGLSELRASAGGLFVAMGLACIIFNTQWAFGMLGVAYFGAALGRLISIFADKPPRAKASLYFAFEAIPAAWLIAANL